MGMLADWIFLPLCGSLFEVLFSLQYCSCCLILSIVCHVMYTSVLSFVVINMLILRRGSVVFFKVWHDECCSKCFLLLGLHIHADCFRMYVRFMACPGTRTNCML